jgi:hypothetical protein
MTCEDVLNRVWEYLDEELAAEEADSLTLHLGGCRNCRVAFCCDRAFLDLIARQRSRIRAPARLSLGVQFLRSTLNNSPRPL